MPAHAISRLIRYVLVPWVLAHGLALPLWAQGTLVSGGAAAVSSASRSGQTDIDLHAWLLRLHEASQRRAYMGTFVVTAGGSTASAKIWHVCDGTQQMERVEALTGAPRSVFRRNDQVMTFLPESKLAVSEKREAMGIFPQLLASGSPTIGQFYRARHAGVARVAGHAADVVLIQPRDSLRYGYRLWSEQKTGIVVKLQTLDAQGQVLEEAAFSELQLDAPVSMGKLSQLMRHTQGYRVITPELVKTTPDAQGWRLREPVSGFTPMSCYQRNTLDATAGPPATTMQWVFSDGLASVSLFVEAFEPARHRQEGVWSTGATQTLTRRLGDASGQWWLTAVGEVPAQTLINFAQGLERKK